MGNRDYLEQQKRKLSQTALNALKLKPTLRVRKIYPNEGDAFCVRYEEYEPFSDFFFEILEFADFKNIACFKCSLKPTSPGNPNESSRFIPLTALAIQLKNWEELVKSYHTKDTVFDDPMVEAHYEEYSRMFPIELIGNDLEKPFVGEASLHLINHCDKLIEEVKAQAEDSVDREKFIADIRALQGDITVEPKGIIFGRLKRLLAEGTVKFPGIFRFLMKEFKTWVVQGGFTRLASSINEALDDLPNLLS